MSKLLNALAIVAVVGSTSATMAEAIDPKIGAVVGGVAGIAAALTRSIVAFKTAGAKK